MPSPHPGVQLGVPMATLPQGATGGPHGPFSPGCYWGSPQSPHPRVLLGVPMAPFPRVLLGVPMTARLGGPPPYQPRDIGMQEPDTGKPLPAPCLCWHPGVRDPRDAVGGGSDAGAVAAGLLGTAAGSTASPARHRRGPRCLQLGWVPTGAAGDLGGPGTRGGGPGMGNAEAAPDSAVAGGCCGHSNTTHPPATPPNLGVPPIQPAPVALLRCARG